MSNNTKQIEPKIGRFKRSWMLLKSSWRAYKQDKELTALPLISTLLTLAVSIPVIAWAFVNHHLFVHDITKTVDGAEVQFKASTYVLAIALGVVITAIGVIFSGALIHGALERFKGNDPTVRGSVNAAMSRTGSLLGFGLFSAVIGYTLSYVAERIPFFGAKIVAWLASSAWNIASFFAVPVIMTSDRPVNPVTATKESIGIIKKTWGESLIVSAGISIFAVLGMTLYTAVFAVLLVVGAESGVNSWILGGGGVLAALVFVVLILVFTTLEAFAKAAIFHYATTGEAPAEFDARLVRSAFTQKKARKIFDS